MSVVLVCYRLTATSEFTYWRDRDEATNALDQLATPTCGPHCIGSHSIVAPAEGRGRVQSRRVTSADRSANATRVSAKFVEIWSDFGLKP
jgi:hypothetical protein